MDLGVSGLASGFDWRSLVDQLIQVEREPEQQLSQNQNVIEQKKIAYGSIKTQLSVLQNRVNTLNDPTLFDARAGQVSDSTVGSVNVASGAPLGQYTFNFSQLASAAQWTGAAAIAAPISSSSDVSGVTLSDAGFSKAVTAGTFTVNGAQVTVDPSQSLQDVFSAIQTATNGDVTASYDPASDKITLTSASGNLTLGSATDTSNFLQVTRLYNTGTASTTSATALGGIKSSVSLVNGNFATPVNDGGAGAGQFTINGVSISYSATGDSLNNVITNINNSAAGVIATYDSINNRVVLTNKSTGDIGINVQDVTGNFAAATGLASGALQRGSNLQYSINGGGTLTSQTNTITEDSSGISGLTVNALNTGNVTVTISSDTSKAKSAIQDFITEYNKTQSMIATDTASSTDSQGKVTAGTLASDSDPKDIAAKLRSLAFGSVSAFSPDMNQLADLGITTNGNDDTLTLQDESALDSALSNNMQGVKKLFTDSTNGLAAGLNKYIDATAGDDGTLTTKDSNLSKQIADIDTQIANMERFIQADQQRMIQSFVNMETVQSQINQQLSFLAQRFGTSGATPTPAASSSSSSSSAGS